MTRLGVDQADAGHLLGREGDRVLVGHLPDVVALEAEVLDAEARRALRAPCPRSRRRSSGRGRRGCRGRGCRSSCPGTAAARRASARRGRSRGSAGCSAAASTSGGGGGSRLLTSSLSGMLETTESTGARCTSPFDWTTMLVTREPSVPDARTAVLEVHRDALALDPLGDPLPHLARTEPRVAELLDQRRHLALVEAEHREERSEEREVLDPLRRPLRADLRSRDPQTFSV